MSKAHPTPAPIGAPSFRILVAVYAWTEGQAERIKLQVAHMFTGSEVTIEPIAAALTAPEPAGDVVPARRVARLVDTLAEKVPGSTLVPALAALVAPAAAPEPARIERPFAIGDTLRDVHVDGRTVTVTDIDDSGCTFDDGTRCPWDSAECYAKVSGAKKAAASTSAKTGAKISTTPRAKKPGAPKDRATLSPVKARQPRARSPKMIGANKSKSSGGAN